ncbi:ribose-phosphate diphosphokinase [Candidatus Woesearchaeota archaeon]|nr:MAG: ribose-phosphate diphosphokinase [Candidatus Woesearchaeota archaeon]
MSDTIVIGGYAAQDLGRKIARHLRSEYASLVVDHFPDGEFRIRYPKKVDGKTVILVESLRNPNDKIVEVIFAAYTAKDLGAKKVFLVAPYMPYLRQDKRFHPGECVSNAILGKMFHVFDFILTVDPHLHRVKSLRGLFRTRVKHISANRLIADYIKKNLENPVIIGPDEESYQWAKTVAKYINSHAIILKKKRYNSRSVRIKIKEDVDFKNSSVVLVDDIISSGHTMMETVKEAKKHGAKKIYCMCVHAILADNADKKLKKLGIKGLVATNSVPSPYSRIDLSGTLAEELKKVL